MMKPATKAAAEAPEDDNTLALSAATTNDPNVWFVFVRRYEPLIRKQLGRALAKGRKYLSSDSIEDALSEFWIALLKSDRKWLRRYRGDRGASLATWLGALAWDVGTKHVRALRRRAAGLPEPVDTDKDPQRGARFIAEERAEIEKPRRREFKGETKTRQKK